MFGTKLKLGTKLIPSLRLLQLGQGRGYYKGGGGRRVLSVSPGAVGSQDLGETHWGQWGQWSVWGVCFEPFSDQPSALTSSAAVMASIRGEGALHRGFTTAATSPPAKHCPILGGGGGLARRMSGLLSEAGGARPPVAAHRCPFLEPFPSAGGGAHRPLTTQCPCSTGHSHQAFA